MDEQEIEKKARELVDKFLPEIKGADRYNYNLDSMNYFISKQCAIICCDEIINSHLNNKWMVDLYTSNKDFWKSVKQFITDKL